MNFEEIEALVKRVNYPGFDIRVSIGHGGWFVQATFLSHDSTGAVAEMVTQWTRRWLLSPYMTKSEVVQTVFKMVMTANEHEVRENFKYNGRAIFGPHHDVDVLWYAVNSLDKREA